MITLSSETPQKQEYGQQAPLTPDTTMPYPTVTQREGPIGSRGLCFPEHPLPSLGAHPWTFRKPDRGTQKSRWVNTSIHLLLLPVTSSFTHKPGNAEQEWGR